MSTPDLEERLSSALQRLAGDLSAPPTGAARGRVSHRTGQLRRRRRVVRAVGCAVLAVAVGSGAVWLSTPHTDETGMTGQLPWPEPPAPTSDRLPMFTIDGYTPTSAQEDPGNPGNPNDDLVMSVPYQLFRSTGDYTGPSIQVTTSYTCDEGIADPEERFANWFECYETGLGVEHPDELTPENLTVQGAPARLWVKAPDVVVVLWLLDDDTTVYVQSRGLTRDELVDFTDGLRRKDESTFDATVLPQDISEQPTSPVHGDPEGRFLEMTGDGETAVVEVRRGGIEEIELYLQSQGPRPDTVERVDVFGRPALLLKSTWGWTDGTGRPSWALLWQHTTDAVVRIGFSPTDRATVLDLIDHIHEIDEATWQELVATHPWGQNQP